MEAKSCFGDRNARRTPDAFNCAVLGTCCGRSAKRYSAVLRLQLIAKPRRQQQQPSYRSSLTSPHQVGNSASGEIRFAQSRLCVNLFRRRVRAAQGCGLREFDRCPIAMRIGPAAPFTVRYHVLHVDFEKTIDLSRDGASDARLRFRHRAQHKC